MSLRSGSSFVWTNLLVLSIAAFIQTSTLARADLTIKSADVVTGLSTGQDGQPVQQFVQSYTTYFSKSSCRMESSNGGVYIFDFSGGLVYQLNSAQETYCVSSIKDVEDFKSQLPKRMANNVSLDSDLSVGESILTSSYLSCSTLDVPIAGYARISRTESGGRPGGGSRRRGGGFPGGGATNLPYGSEGSGGSERHGDGSGRFPSYQVQGDLWTSPTYQFPKQKHFSCLPIALQVLWGCPPMIGEMSDTLAQVHQIPLHAVINITQTHSSTTSTTVTTTFDVTSISMSPIDQSMFSIPSGYAKGSSPVSFPQLESRPLSSPSGDDNGDNRADGVD